MNEVLFSAKICLLWVLWLMLRYAWDRMVRKSSAIPLAAELLASSEDRALVHLWTRASWGEISRREWLFRVAFSPVMARFNLLILAIITYELCVHGGFMDLNPLLRQEEPPEWLFWLGDSAPPTLAIFAAVGALTTSIVLHPYLPTVIALILTFNGVISLPGALLLIQGERWAVRVLFAWFFRDRMPRWDFAMVLAVQSVLTLICIFWARDFFVMAANLFHVDSLRAFDRFCLLAIGLFFWLAIECAIQLVVYHFYFNHSEPEKMVDTFPPPPVMWAGWLTSWLRGAVMLRVLQRFQALERMARELDGDLVREKIPGAVLARMEKERKDLRKILKA